MVAAADGESSNAPSPSPSLDLPGFVRVNPAGIGGSILGVPALASVFLPWILFRLSAAGESESNGYTLWSAASDVGEARVFFFALIVVGLVSVASVVLPRVVAAIIAFAGLAIAITAYFYIEGLLVDALRGESRGGSTQPCSPTAAHCWPPSATCPDSCSSSFRLGTGPGARDSRMKYPGRMIGAPSRCWRALRRTSPLRLLSLPRPRASRSSPADPGRVRQRSGGRPALVQVRQRRMDRKLQRCRRRLRQGDGDYGHTG